MLQTATYTARPYQSLLNPIDYICYYDLAKSALKRYSRALTETMELEDRIADLETRLTNCTTKLSLAPSHGGAGTEHRMEDTIAYKAELEDQLEANLKLIEAMKKAIDLLPSDEYRILQIADIRDSKDVYWYSVAMEALHISRPTAYRLHDRALWHLGELLFKPVKM